ncbi:MAG: metallophosphoesterase family protein [Promethearchaeota archaeon]
MKPVKFVHIADLHLGKRQYNLYERYNDYFRAFKWILTFALNEEVDFLLIAGDIFDHKNIGPSVLSELFHIIRNFKNKCFEKLNRNIPLICIEGNHDNPIYSAHSWMSFLAELDLIVLLAGEYDREAKTFRFDEYSDKTHRGGMIEINDMCIYGLPFFGSFTSQLFPAIKNAIPKIDSKFNLLMMHFGIEGQDKIKTGVKLSPSLMILHENVDYLALGHYHKQYTLPSESPWIFNPGSLETNDLSELSFTRGAFIAEISGKEYYQQQITSIECDNGDIDPTSIPNRKFVSISSINIEKTDNFDESVDLILDYLQKWGVPLHDSKSVIDKSDLNCPIVFFSIKGEIVYSRLEIDLNKLRNAIKKKFALLDVRIFTKELLSKIDQSPVGLDEMTIDEIEKEVILSIIEENSQYNPIKDEVLALMNDTKSQLTQRRPNNSELKEQITEWCVANLNGFKKPSKIERVITEIEEKETEEKKENSAKKEELQRKIKEKQKEYESLKAEKKETENGFDPFDEFNLDLNDYIDDGKEEEDNK